MHTRGRSARLGGDSPLPQGARHALDKIPNGGLRDPVEERTIEGLAKESKGRLVSSAQPELSQVRSEGSHLQLTFQRREDAARPSGPPCDGQPSAAGCANRWAQLDLHPFAKLKRANRETDLCQQLITMFLCR